MAKRRRTTSRQRVASRKNILKAQKVSARKRRGIRKGVLVGVGTAAVLGTGIAAYRRYDRKAEAGQKAHLSYKAWHARMHLPIDDDADVLHASMLKPHKQPRRYAGQPASRQSKFALQAHRKKVLGKRTGSMINALENAVTAKSPIELTHSRRHTPMAPWKLEYDKLKFSKRTSYRLQQRIGSHTHLVAVTRVR